MSESRAPDSPPQPSDPERDAFIAAVEEGLEDLKAGRVFTHEQVQAEMRQRFPASKKRSHRSAADE